ncbi:LysR substrate binding domain-containing protein [Agromyces sp. CF514]|uniref:LysR family transcriptional regulator substrate-binding protein n=1 Tax=Agromyces sp. CF514 TaxID=1881031 RepID=UPI0008E79197|nr:LysR family transcriptional regulator substrate-binding protein [Agromyces sp. CF514]SFR84818.1 LysR substrate binding domain-containing protein [Agromyces sp. CF514]
MTLQLRYVAGVSPAKWLRVWAERRPDLPLAAERVDESAQLDGVREGEVDLAFVRLPVETDGLHVIALWEEQPVAVLAKEHAFADEASLTLADLADEPHAPVQDDVAMTIELVAAGTGMALVPHGVARLHARKDVVAIPVTDAATTRIALVWTLERDDADIQEFVGVVRGRKAQSSRGQADDEPALSPAKAAKKAAAERRAAEAAKGGKGSGKGAKSAKSARPAPRTGSGAKQRSRRRGR